MLLASFWDLVSNPATLAIFMSMMIPIVAIIAGYWHSVEKTRSINSLKQTMLERGMSAEEIERVLAADGRSSDEDDE